MISTLGEEEKECTLSVYFVLNVQCYTSSLKISAFLVFRKLSRWRPPNHRRYYVLWNTVVQKSFCGSTNYKRKYMKNNSASDSFLGGLNSLVNADGG